MSFANPAGSATANAAKYVEALMQQLGDREPLGVQRQLLSSVRSILDAMTPEEISQPEKPGKWSAIDVVRHLMHTELVYAYRYRMTMAQDEPDIPGFDQDAWAANLQDDGGDIATMLDRLTALRNWNLQYLQERTAQDLERRGRHAERGWESLIHQVKLGAAHDLVHCAQLTRCQQAAHARR